MFMHDEDSGRAPAGGDDRPDASALPAEIRRRRVLRRGGLPGGMARPTRGPGASQDNPIFEPAHGAAGSPLMG